MVKFFFCFLNFKGDLLPSLFWLAVGVFVKAGKVYYDKRFAKGGSASGGKGENMDQIDILLTKGVEEVIEKSSLEKKLKSDQKLRIKHGVDPTGPKIHIGRALQFWKLKKFQDLGHKIILIIGDFTAQIGDASDKHAMRKPLSETEIKKNLKDYEKQIGKILDMSKVELRYNSEWLKKLSAKDLLELAMNFTVQQMIHRRNFKERWEAGKEIGLHETVYPLLQGYDSVAIKADVEIGGSDQLFNLLAGREIQKKFGQKPQDIITLKMLTGLDARKMSTSWGNVVNITDEPNDMFGKIMSMKDEMIKEYLELCVDIDVTKVEKIKNPRDQKAKLAFEIVKMYYDKNTALSAEKEFEKVFKDKGLPSSMPIIKLSDGTINPIDLLIKSNVVFSRSDAKRLIDQGAITIINNDKYSKINDMHKAIGVDNGMIIRIGSKRFIKIEK